jgi:hypothetical protein
MAQPPGSVMFTLKNRAGGTPDAGELISFALGSPDGTVIGSPGAVTNPSGWQTVYATRKVTGTNATILFRPVTPSNTGSFFFYCVDDAGNVNEIFCNTGLNIFNAAFNGTNEGTGSANVKSKYLRFRKTGTVLTFTIADTNPGVETVLYTFFNGIGTNSAMKLRVLFDHNQSAMNLTDANYLGQSITDAP